MKRNSPLQDGGEAHEAVPPLKAILTRPVVLSITCHLCVSFIDMAYCALQPLFFATPIHLGGLGLSPARIGLCLGTFGLVCGTFQGLFLAKIIRRLGLKRVFFTGVSCFIPLFVMFPVMNHFARERGLSPVVWALVVLQYMFNCITSMCFGRLLHLSTSTSLTPSPSRPSRLCVSIRVLFRGEPASTRECEWNRTCLRLLRPSVESSGGIIPLRIHATERLARRTRGLYRLYDDSLVRCAPRIHAPGESMGTQVTKHLCLTSRISFGV